MITDKYLFDLIWYYLYESRKKWCCAKKDLCLLAYQMDLISAETYFRKTVLFDLEIDELDELQERLLEDL